MSKRKKRPPVTTIDEAAFTEELPVEPVAEINEAEFTEEIPEPTAPPRPAPEAPGTLETFGRSAANALTLGWGDELSARLAGVLGGDMSHVDEDATRINNERLAAAEANPRTAFAGSLAGGIVGAAPIVAATGGASLPGLMGLGAGQAAVQSVGEAPADQPVIDTAFDALGSGMIGASLPVVGAAAAPVIKAAARPAGEWMQGLAQRVGDVGGEARVRAAYPFGARGAITTTQDIAQRPGGLAAHGRDMRAAGITGLTPEAHRAKAETLRRTFGPRVGESVRAMDEAGAVAELSPNDVERITKLLRPADARGALPARTTRARLEAANPEETGTLPVQVAPSEAWNMRRQVDDYTDFASEGVTQKERQDLYNSINARIGEGAESVDPALAQNWRDSSRNYSLAADVEDAAGYSANRQAGSAGNPGGLMRGMMGGLGMGGLASGVAQQAGAGPTMTAAVGIAGSAAGAAGLRGITSRWQGIKAGTAERLSDVLEMAPERLGVFARVLGQAHQRGGSQGVATTHFKLSANNPAYRQMLREIGLSQNNDDGAYNDPEEL